MLALLSTIFLLVTGGICMSIPRRELRTGTPCHDFEFIVPLNSFNDTGVIQPSATYNISASYCPPTTLVSHRANTIQLLLHGGTSNKLYWSALGPVNSNLQYQPHNYSYVDFARNEGYHTVAIDRLGCGNSSHPNPILVRAGMQAELTASIIHQLRQQKSSAIIPRARKIIIIGHSYGSFVINLLLNKHPEAVNATVMTSFVHVFSNAVSSVGEQQFAPASSVFPARFSGLDPGYVTLSNRTNERETWLSNDGSFDPQMPSLLFDHDDAQASGELNSINDETSGDFSTAKAVGYVGPLAIMMGQDDQVFCNGDCGMGDQSLIALSRPFFPDVRDFQGFLMPNTGHALQYHFTAREGFQRLHLWLGENGF
jgi:pimeloyl-ACP methyl ester carboxylesterase